MLDASGVVAHPADFNSPNSKVRIAARPPLGVEILQLIP